MTDSLAKLFERDLQKLIEELQSYSHESELWILDNNIKNCAGNLALHICGNLKHFVGAILGNTGYERNRPAEFEDKNIPRSAIIENIDETIVIVKNTLGQLDQAKLAEIYPREVMGKTITTEFFLLHLLAHLNYHLGQVNYHRRLLSER